MHVLHVKEHFVKNRAEHALLATPLQFLQHLMLSGNETLMPSD
jgi:hypothetical protein